MSTWRIYSASSTFPEALVPVGKVCEQIAFGKQLFPVRGKNAPIPTERRRYGQRGPYCLDLGAVASTPTKARKPAKKQSTKAQVVASTSLVLTVPIQKELSRKVERKLSDQMSLELHSPPDITPPRTLALPQPAPLSSHLRKPQLHKSYQNLWIGMGIPRCSGHVRVSNVTMWIPFATWFRRHALVLYPVWLPKIIFLFSRKWRCR